MTPMKSNASVWVSSGAFCDSWVPSQCTNPCALTKCQTQDICASRDFSRNCLEILAAFIRIIDVLTAIPCSLSLKIKDKRESENGNKHDCMPLHKLFDLLFVASINCGNCLFQSLINFLLMLMLLHTECCDAPLFIRQRT